MYLSVNEVEGSMAKEETLPDTFGVRWGRGMTWTWFKEDDKQEVG
jgi:hypothetical protein